MAVVNSPNCELCFMEIGIKGSWVGVSWIGFKGFDRSVELVGCAQGI